MEDKYILPTVEEEKEVLNELPKWVKILFRFYAVVFLLGTIFVAVNLVYYSVVISGQELLATVTDSAVSTSGILGMEFVSFALVFLILEVIYGIGVFTYKRWVLPLVLVFAFSTLLISFLNLLNLNFAGIAELVILFIGMSFMGVVGYAAIRYWNMFTGPARKLLIQIPLLIVLLPFILFATLWQIFPDDARINDSDLVLQPVELLSQSDNAYYFIPDIESLPLQQQQAYETALDYAKEAEDTNLNNQEAINLVANTKDVTDSFISAASKRGYQCPTVVNNYSFEAEICALNDVRNLATLTSLRAGVEADTGNADQALSTGVAIVQLGDLIGNAEQTFLIEHLVGIALMNIGLESIERTLNTSATTSNQALQSAAADLDQYKTDRTVFADSLRLEYMGLKDSLQTFAPLSNYFYQHNKTINQQAEFFRMQIAVSVQGCEVDTSQEQQAITEHVKEIQSAASKWPIISPNFIGKILNSIIVASLNTAGQKSCEANELNQQVQELLQDRISTEVSQ